MAVEESKREVEDVLLSRIAEWFNATQELQFKTDEEIAEMLMEHVWSDIDLFTVQSELVSEAARRLGLPDGWNDGRDNG